MELKEDSRFISLIVSIILYVCKNTVRTLQTRLQGSATVMQSSDNSIFRLVSSSFIGFSLMWKVDKTMVEGRWKEKSLLPPVTRWWTGRWKEWKEKRMKFCFTEETAFLGDVTRE